jgi:hypothetical protein
MLNDKERIKQLISTNGLGVHKSALFIINSYLDGTIEDIDFELYSNSVNVAYSVLLKVQSENKPIHGDFYPELRQRYFDLLNCSPVEDSNSALNDSHLAWMLTELSNPDMSETKKHRWLGYIQGVLAAKSHIIVNDERDATRDVFKGK